jgi:soluble lytic murein transglycosylase
VLQSNLPEQPLDRAQEDPKRPSDGVAPFDLQQFTPLILMDGLQRATEALERGDAPLAARTVEQVIASKPLDQAPGWQYLLARLYEQAGEVAPAVRAYQTSAAYSWTLTGYAELGAGRVLLKAGNPKAALLELEKIPDEEPLKSAAALLVANAALASGNSAFAVERLRAHLAPEKLPEDWGAAAALLSRSLLERNPTVSADTSADDPRVAEQLEALKWARKAQLASSSESTDASELEAKILRGLPPKVQADVAALSVDESIERLGALLRTRKYSAAHSAADELLVRLGRERFANQGCEAQLIRARALGGEGLWGKAVDTLSDAIAQCVDPDQHANLLYLAGKSAFADKRYSAAAQFFSRLESDAPKHQLADDARLYGALAYRELGVEARFTELLSTMAEEYPDGDMTLEGVFRLAVRQLEKRDFSTAVQVLERALQVQKPERKKPRIEELGREQYFLARARIESGEVERGLSEYEQRACTPPIPVGRRRCCVAPSNGVRRSRSCSTCRALEIRCASIARWNCFVSGKWTRRVASSRSWASTSRR